VIETEDLRKRYRGTPEGTGLAGVDLSVGAGSVCGLLGPNGAGKTTMVRILTTLLAPDSGRARVAAYDVRRQPAEVRRRIGLVGQYAAVDEILTGRQNLELFGRLHHLGAAGARRRAGELLDRFGLADAAERSVGRYSGGMRRRLDLAVSLIVAPPVLFLDEPTAGLDPQGRFDVWEAVRELVGGGTTVLLTTQYLEEADQLADRVCMLQAGRVVAEGRPAELKAAMGGDRVDVTAASDEEAAEVAAAVRAVGAGEPVVTGSRVSVPVTDGTRALMRIAGALGERGLDPADVTLRRPTLDEVFRHVVAGSSASPAVSEVSA
jgi:ABC-2 type transport system ATP-binding protein